MKLVLMMTDENIVGREILTAFSAYSTKIDAVIVEKSERAEQKKGYLENDFYAPPSFASLVRGVEVHTVGNLNGEYIRSVLDLLKPDIILLDGLTVMKPVIYEKARLGAIKAHPGLLPEFRGEDSVQWAIFHGKPVGGTCHFVNSGIDTGAILVRREVPYEVGESLLEICVRVMRECAWMMQEAVSGIANGSIGPVLQPAGGDYFSLATPDVERRVEEILAGR